ncbi:MAG: aminodeoxychorismate synthase component I, partial [Agrobacterium albertimagni]
MRDHAPYALFRDDRAGTSLVFAEPETLVVARSADEVEPALAKLEAHRKSGKWLAGYLSYEAGFVFEPKLRPLI